jgi:PTH1 family peptidyl-tRNA hydrolase
MLLIVGLGNPDKKYQNTPHNMGFRLVERVAEKLDAAPFRLEGQYEGEITQSGQLSDRVFLFKPQTYMNKSGQAVKKVMDYYKLGMDDLWVICDDIDLELGMVRSREGGSSGGHKGLQSVIEVVGTDEFVRVRLGVGRDEKIDPEKYVLMPFNKDKEEKVSKIIDKTAEIIVQSLNQGLEEETINVKS